MEDDEREESKQRKRKPPGRQDFERKRKPCDCRSEHRDEQPAVSYGSVQPFLPRCARATRLQKAGVCGGSELGALPLTYVI